MSMLGVNGALAGVYQYAATKGTGKTQGAGISETNFTDQLKETEERAGTSKVDAYQEYLKQKYGNVMVKDVGKDQRSIDALGASTAGYNNVVIAPNILEQMANDPKKAAYYENKIQAGLDDFPKVRAQLSAAGFEIYSYGVSIASDGTVYTYTCGDVSPEKKAKIEAQIKAEDEAKAKRKKQYQERSQKAAEERRLEMEIAIKKQNLDLFLRGHSRF